MGSFILRRIAYGFAILLGVNLLTFFLFFTVNTPDDMARLNIGGKRVTQEQIDKWKAERGYDRPLYWNAAAEGPAKLTRTVLWERSISLMALDFGRSDSARSTDIGHEVATRMGVSLQLALPLHRAEREVALDAGGVVLVDVREEHVAQVGPLGRAVPEVEAGVEGRHHHVGREARHGEGGHLERAELQRRRGAGVVDAPQGHGAEC